MKHWAFKYIGLPYRPGGRDEKGLDCFGLLKLVYLREKGIDIPDLPGIAEQNASTIMREVSANTAQNWTELDRPQEGCLVAMGRRLIFHVGIWTDVDGGKVIHVANHSVVAETIRSLRLKGIRLIKFFVYGSHR